MTPASAASRLKARSRRGYRLAALVLVGALAVVVFFAREAGERERELARADFTAEAARSTELLRQRLLTYELTARGGVSLFASVDWPSALQWKDYVDGLQVQERALGLMGLGYAADLTPDALAQLQLRLREAGQGLYQVRPHGVRPRYGPIVYLEPGTAANQQAIGFDMYADPARRQAMAAARETGQVRLTQPVSLVQQSPDDVPDGLLMYAPVQAGARIDVAGDGARMAPGGWVYVPFEARALVQSALGAGERGLQLRITDVTPGQAPTLLHADTDFDAARTRSNALHVSLPMPAYGRQWRVEFTSTPQPRAAIGGLSLLQTTLIAGTLASLLLFAVVLTLARTQAHAQRLADRMSESYRRSEARFRSAMNYSAIGKALLDESDRIVEANPALARILGLAGDTLPGRSFGGLLLDEAGAAQAEPVPDADGVLRATRQMMRPDGERRRVQLTYAPVPGHAGTGVVRLVQVEDATDRLRAQARVRDLNRTLEARVAARTRELAQANRDLEAFAYSVSHDLRAPLRSIDGFGRVLGERYRDQLDAAGQGYLSRIRGATKRMDGLIDALLAMSRVSRAQLNMAPLDLETMAEDIVAELRQSDPDREVAVHIAPCLSAHGDPALIRNLLQNLLANAWKFTANTAQASIEMGVGAHACHPNVFFIQDNGAGFDPAYADKLFRPFQRLHHQDEFAGHGVGLASVKRIVERHGGEVWAEGAPGQGACFRFRLPEGPPAA